MYSDSLVTSLISKIWHGNQCFTFLALIKIMIGVERAWFKETVHPIFMSNHYYLVTGKCNILKLLMIFIILVLVCGVSILY